MPGVLATGAPALRMDIKQICFAGALRSYTALNCCAQIFRTVYNLAVNASGTCPECGQSVT